MSAKTNVSDDRTDYQITTVRDDDPADVHARTPIYIPSGHNSGEKVHTKRDCQYLKAANRVFGPRPRGRYPDRTVCTLCQNTMNVGNTGRRNKHSLADLLADPDVTSIEDAREKRDQYAIAPEDDPADAPEECHTKTDETGELVTDGGRRSLVKAFRGPGDDYVTTFKDAEPCAECGKANAGVRAPDDRALCATCYTDATENGGRSE